MLEANAVWSEQLKWQTAAGRFFIPGSALIADVRSVTKCVGNLDGCKAIPNERPGQQTEPS